MAVKTYVLLTFTVLAWLLCLHLEPCNSSDDMFNQTVGSRSRRKRIVGGRLLESHDLYKTHYIIEMRETWSCVSEQTDHVLGDCWHRHWCGGALVHPRFVLTACHCLSYSNFYKEDYERPLPYVPDVDPIDVPSYLTLRWPPWVTGKLKEVVTPFHPLQNAMTLWAGSPNMNRMTQRRHASAFFPHQYCVHYQQQKYPDKWINTPYEHYEFDVGLVKTCMPFVLNKDVSLAPMRPTNLLKSQLEDLVRKSAVCLYAGWGVIPKRAGLKATGEDHPETLNHIWRYVECSKSCHDYYPCILCSHTHGPKITYNSKGDSGSPINCEGYVVGVISRGRKDDNMNISDMMDFPIACIANQLQTSYLDRLKELNDVIFHWINGKPVPTTPPKT